MRYAGQYQVKQYVAVVRNGRGQRFRVFETADARYYLFDALIGESSVSGGNQFPVLKSDLRDDIRRGLRHGVGNSI